MHRRWGMVRPQRYVRLYNYYTSQNLPPDNVEQPLFINYFKSICDKHTSYLFGQWHDDIVSYRVKQRVLQDPSEDNTAHTIRTYLEDFLDANNKNATLWDCALNGSVYGDGILRLRWDVHQRRVIFESLLPEWFHARWDIADMNRLTEVIIAYPIDRQDALEQYKTAGNEAVDYQMIDPTYLPGFGIYWEHWTPQSYRIWIDDSCIVNEPNPYAFRDNDGNLYGGIIPFVHVPNMRVGGEFYGFSDGENILYLQDELNRRMADMGDIVNNHAHPVVTLNKFHGDQAQLPVGPDAVWDLGTEGTAKLLEWSGTPPAVLEYIQMCKDMMYDIGSMPEVAFGRGIKSGGSSSKSGASGLALQMAMMPIVERATQKRIFWTIALERLADMAVMIHASQDKGSLPFSLEQYQNYSTTPVWASILPRDRLQQVNENVALSNTNLRSIERSLEDLGEENIAQEYKRIKTDARFKAALGMTPPQPGGKNSDRGQGGSPGLNGPGAANTKPGNPAKAAY